MSLESRKVKILQAVVWDYVNTTRPVGSERLIEAYQLGCKSATVRNEMAELTELGYIIQPHTSAGRIPTDQGYRYYVDQLMDPPSALTREDTNNATIRSQTEKNEIEAIIQQTCRILADMTSCTSLATDPVSEATTLHRVYLSTAGARHLLLVVLLSTSQVEHRLVEADSIPSDASLTKITNYLNSVLAGKDIDEVARFPVPVEFPSDLMPQVGLIGKIVAILRTTATTLIDRKVYLEGTNHLLRQPEFSDVQRLEALLTALQEHNVLYSVLAKAMADPDILIIIGSENNFAPMQECTIITTSYCIGSVPVGTLGVLGPTRMNYDRAVASVGLMAKSLSQMLSNYGF